MMKYTFHGCLPINGHFKIVPKLRGGLLSHNMGSMFPNLLVYIYIDGIKDSIVGVYTYPNCSSNHWGFSLMSGFSVMYFSYQALNTLGDLWPS